MAETPYTAPPGATIWQKLGPGGLASFLLASLSALLLLGLPVWLRIASVLRGAKGGDLEPADAILVLGRRLKQDRPTDVFIARLVQGFELWRRGLAPYLMVAGGRTGKASISEGETGRAWLLAQGMEPSRILVEDQSQHTLENLFHVRETLKDRGWKRLILVSDALHLARAQALAEGLGLEVIPWASEGCPPRPGSAAWYWRAIREAFLLHWYHTGVAYSRCICSQKQLARIR